MSEVLGGWLFLMCEVPLCRHTSLFVPGPTSHATPFEGYPRAHFWKMGTFLEPYCGHVSPKVDKIFIN